MKHCCSFTMNLQVLSQKIIQFVFSKAGLLLAVMAVGFLQVAAFSCVSLPPPSPPPFHTGFRAAKFRG